MTEVGIFLVIVFCFVLATKKLAVARSSWIILGPALCLAGIVLGVPIAVNALFKLPEPHYHEYEDALAKAPQFLHECAPNEIRVVFFGSLSPDAFSMGPPEIGTWKVDLITGNWRISFDEAAHSSAIASNQSNNPYTPQQTDKIKALIAALPTPRWKLLFFGGSFEDQTHFAFYQDNTLHIYDYSQDEAKSQRERFSEIFESR